MGTESRIASSIPQNASHVGVAAARWLLSAFVALFGCGTPSAGNGFLGDDSGGASSGSSNGGTSEGGGAPGVTPDGGGLLNGNPDGGAALDGSQPERCGSVGSTRSCCTTGTQTCSGNEFPTWGPCLDSVGGAVTCALGCIAGENGKGCDGGVDSGADSGGAPDGGCTPGMVCKPGAIRYCDVTGTEWTRSACDATGNWGPCLATTAPNGAGCVQSSFQPEICCPPLHLCCQDNPGGPWKDWSSGGCVAISCP